MTTEATDDDTETVRVELPKELAREAVGVLDAEVRQAERAGEVHSTEETMSELSDRLSQALDDPDEGDEFAPFIFRLHGINGASSEYDHLFEVGQGGKLGCDHQAHEASSRVMRTLRENFDWAEDITGVSMGTL